MAMSRARKRRNQIRHRRTVPFGSKHDGDWSDTRGEGLSSARAREVRRARRDVTEHLAVLDG